jgi:chromobox protein 5
VDTSEPEDAEDEEEEYEVEKILDHRMVGRKRHFQVKWRGYPVSEATWEPEANLASCRAMIATYMEKHTPAKSPAAKTGRKRKEEQEQESSEPEVKKRRGGRQSKVDAATASSSSTSSSTTTTPHSTRHMQVDEIAGETSAFSFENGDVVERVRGIDMKKIGKKQPVLVFAVTWKGSNGAWSYVPRDDMYKYASASALKFYEEHIELD